MQLLAEELRLSVDQTEFKVADVPVSRRAHGNSFSFLVPYDSEGMPSKKLHPWDLSAGAKVKLTGGPGTGFVGTVQYIPDATRQHSFSLSFPCTREGPHLGKGKNLYALGTWFVEDAIHGRLSRLPVVNIHQ